MTSDGKVERMSNSLPPCPFCNSDTRLGERSHSDLMWGESPIECPTHGEVGMRDHEFGLNVMQAPTEDHKQP